MRYLLTVCVIFIFVAGCTNSKTNSHNKSKVYTPSNTDIVNGNSTSEIENETRLIEFIQNIKIGQKDNIRVVGYTKEGDPILTDIVFNGEQLEVTRDNTRDDHGSNEIETFNCEKIIIKDKKYLITGCEGYEMPYYLAENYR